MNLKEKIASLTTNIGATIIKRSPELLAGTGIACFIGSTVSAVMATPKAVKLLEEEKTKFTPVDGNPEDTVLPLKQKVKTVWKVYLPSACMSVGGICFVTASVSTSNSRYLALSTSYELLKDAAYTYRDKVIETIGVNKDKKIREQIAQEKIDKDESPNKTVVIAGQGNTLFRDSLTGQYFRYDINKFKNKAIELANMELAHNYAGVPEWLNELGLDIPDTMLGMGWSAPDQGKVVTVDFTACVAHKFNDEPCLVIDYDPMPVSDYYIYYK